MARAAPQPGGRHRRILGVLGMIGSVACSASMVLGTLGVGGTAAAAGGVMAEMSGASGPFAEALSFLVWAGPVILVLSMAAVGAAVSARRRGAIPIVAVAGASLFWGMYLQPDRSVMFVAITAGLGAVIVAYLWATGRHRPDSGTLS